jgi:hypothetical protein
MGNKAPNLNKVNDDEEPFHLGDDFKDMDEVIR